MFRNNINRIIYQSDIGMLCKNILLRSTLNFKLCDECNENSDSLNYIILLLYRSNIYCVKKNNFN